MSSRIVPIAAMVVLAGIAVATQTPERPRDESPALDVDAFRYRRTVAAGDGLVALRLDAAVLAHSRGPRARFADLRLVDEEGRQIPYVLERLEDPLLVDVALEAITGGARTFPSDGRSRSFYAVPLPYENLPRPSLVLETSARLFSRSVRVGIERAPDRSHRDAWFEEIAASMWTHTDPQTRAAPLTLSLGTATDERLLLVVDEGDNSPLPITRASVHLPSYRLRFYGGGRPVHLLYGRDDLGAPSYDLALTEARLLEERATEVTMGEEAEAAQAAAGETPLVSPGVFWGGLSVAVLVLVALIVRLMKP